MATQYSAFARQQNLKTWIRYLFAIIEALDYIYKGQTVHLFKTRTNVTDQMFTKAGTGLSSDGPDGPGGPGDQGGQGGQGGQDGPGCQCGPDVHKSWDGVVFRWPRLDLLTDCQIDFNSTIESIRTAF